MGKVRNTASQGAEDGVDRAPLQAEFAQVRAGQQCTWRLEQVGGGA
jgi:hypothetical protein